ncbi:MAG TPA: hypothetical protein VN457_05400 [Chlamydiales bacterium]|nr:hypothetical protein [Chlamydiales bacterium]
MGQLDLLTLKSMDEESIEKALHTAFRTGNLIRLCLEKCSLSTLAVLEKKERARQIEELQLLQCYELPKEGYAVVSGCTALKKLVIDYAPELDTLDFVTPLVHVTHLTVSRCASITDVKPIAGLKDLVGLDLASSGGIHLTDYAPLSELKKLESLDLSNHVMLRSLNFLAGMQHIKYLNLNYCINLSDIRMLEHLPALQALHLKECFLIEPELGFIIQRQLPQLTVP